MYATQLLLADSVRFDAAYSVADTLSKQVYILANPWVHSNHLHIILNSVFFAVLGWALERKLASLKFGIGVVVIGYLTNLVPPVAGFGGRGAGISGITNALAAFLVIYYLLEYREHQSTKALYGFILTMAYTMVSVGQHIDFVSVGAGVTTEAHVVGVFLGFLWIGLHHGYPVPDCTEAHRS